jgi:hypothetical protein
MGRHDSRAQSRAG